MNSPARAYAACIESFAQKSTLASFYAREDGALWRLGVINNLTHRIPRSAVQPPDFVLYTDAATPANRIASLLLLEGNSNPPVALRHTSQKPRDFGAIDSLVKNEISGVGTISPPLAFLRKHREHLQNSSINRYIANNNNVSTSLAREESAADQIAATVACFWRIAESFSIDIWIGRAADTRNPSDLPSRDAHPLQCVPENGV